MFPELDVEHMEHAVGCQAWIDAELASCPLDGMVKYSVTRASEEFSKRSDVPLADEAWKGNYLKKIDRVEIVVITKSEQADAIAAWLSVTVIVGCARFYGESHTPITLPIDDACPDECIIGVDILFRVKQRHTVDLFGPFYMQ